MEIFAVLLLHVLSIDTGKLSYYFPGDGSNGGELACGGSFTPDMQHIAYRGWRRMGCGRLVMVCAQDSFSCTLSRIRDAGPFGIVKGRKWRVHTGDRAPRGWRWRAAADLSIPLWHELGRPRPLSRIYLVFLPHGVRTVLHRAELAFERLLAPWRGIPLG